MDDSQSPLKVDQFMPTFVPGGMGGGETYARQLFQELSNSGNLSLQAIVPETARGFTEPERESVLTGVRSNASSLGRLLGVFRILMRSASVARNCRQDAVKFVPFTSPVISKKRLGKIVLTIHDVQHRELPEMFSKLELIYRSWMYERPARAADRIITISEYAKQTIVRELRISPSKISVIPLGVDTSLFTPNFGERDNFVYYPARGWPHKNHKNLIEAMKFVRLEHPEMRLVLTGGALEPLGELPEWVENRGHVDFSEVQELYRSARVLAFPSLYEGFGLPPIEAMASGCPVATSNAASLPEVCGDAVIYFDPTSPKEIAAGVLQAIAETDRLVPLGIERSKVFTWEKCAVGHLRVFEETSLKS